MLNTIITISIILIGAIALFKYSQRGYLCVEYNEYLSSDNQYLVKSARVGSKRITDKIKPSKESFNKIYIPYAHNSGCCGRTIFKKVFAHDEDVVAGYDFNGYETIPDNEIENVFHHIERYQNV